MSVVQHEAVSIVHAGLADVLHWLGETPIEPWEPRHAADWWYAEVYVLPQPTVPVRVDHYQVPN